MPFKPQFLAVSIFRLMVSSVIVWRLGWWARQNYEFCVVHDFAPINQVNAAGLHTSMDDQ